MKGTQGTGRWEQSGEQWWERGQAGEWERERDQARTRGLFAQLPLACLRLGLAFCVHLSCILSFFVCRRGPSRHWVLFLFANLWLLRRLKPWFVWLPLYFPSCFVVFLYPRLLLSVPHSKVLSCRDIFALLCFLWFAVCVLVFCKRFGLAFCKSAWCFWFGVGSCLLAMAASTTDTVVVVEEVVVASETVVEEVKPEEKPEKVAKEKKVKAPKEKKPKKPKVAKTDKVSITHPPYLLVCMSLSLSPSLQPSSLSKFHRFSKLFLLKLNLHITIWFSFFLPWAVLSRNVCTSGTLELKGWWVPNCASVCCPLNMICFKRIMLEKNDFFFLEFVLLHWGSLSFLCAFAAVLTWQIECFHIFVLHVKNMSTISGFPFLHFPFLLYFYGVCFRCLSFLTVPKLCISVLLFLAVMLSHLWCRKGLPICKSEFVGKKIASQHGFLKLTMKC